MQGYGGAPMGPYSSPYKGGGGQYDNASSFGGGGFFTSPSGGGAPKLSQDNQAGRPANNERTLTALTIKQIHNAQPSPINDSKFLVDNRELNQVKIVGCILNVQVQSTNIAYTIDDSTGLIDVKIWQGEAEDDSVDQQRQRQELVAGVYVRVFGKVQEFHSTKTISGFCLRPLRDYNEIASHLALCAVTHLANVRGPPSHQSAKSDPIGSGSSANIAGLTKLQSAIMDVFRTNHVEENGLSVAAVNSLVGHSFTHDEVKRDLVWMAEEGHLYSTCDEDHFRTTGTLM